MINKELHIVLGGAGAVGQAVIKELQKRKKEVIAVGRNKQIRGIRTLKADLLISNETNNAVKGASHVYLCIGLPYNSKIWTENWPIIMENVINACESNNAKLIFLDNNYMYGPSPLSVPCDELESQTPESKKGKVRKIIADMALVAHKEKRIQVVIGRSADFYGPNALNSYIYIGSLQNMLNGKKPQSLGLPNQDHTYAYTEDVGKALVELALDESAYGEVWHLPVGNKTTLEEIVKIINKELDTDYEISYMPKTMLSILSLFIPVLKEVKEMSYQLDNPYQMSWLKFHKKFPDFVVTPYSEGIKQMIISFGK